MESSNSESVIEFNAVVGLWLSNKQDLSKSGELTLVAVVKCGLRSVADVGDSVETTLRSPDLA
jgi:hypothetical protein